MSTDFDPNNNSLNAKRYTNLFDLALQQRSSLLMDKVNKGKTFASGANKLQEIVRYDETSMREFTGLNQKISQSSIGFEQRWVNGTKYYDSQLLNDIQQLKDMIQNPQSAIVQAQTSAALRKIDEVILSKFFSNALTGTDGGQTTAFDTTNNVVSVSEGAASATGMNLKKIQAVIKLAKKNEIVPQEEPLCMVMTEEQEDDLRKQVEANNSDYTAAYSIVRDAYGGFKSILGVDIVCVSTARLAKYAGDAQLLDSNSYRRVPVFTKKGMSMSMWKMHKMDITDRKDIEGLPKQFYIEQYIGASRLDEKRVFEIKCSEA
jgi:hypothetical protein